MNLRALTRLGMLRTGGDPVADLDDDLGRLAEDLCAARVRGEHAMAARLLTDIDRRLDERAGFPQRTGPADPVRP